MNLEREGGRLNRREVVKKGYKPFKVTGQMAHQRPKNHVDHSRIVYARDAIHALEVYRRQLKGVKKKKFIAVIPLYNQKKGDNNE